MVTCTEEFCMLEYLSVQGGRVPITRVQWQKTFVDQSVKRMKHLPPPRNTIWILLKVSTVVKVLRRHPVAVSMNKPQSFLSVSFIFVFTNTNENHETIQVSAEMDKCMFHNSKKSISMMLVWMNVSSPSPCLSSVCLASMNISRLSSLCHLVEENMATTFHNLFSPGLPCHSVSKAYFSIIFMSPVTHEWNYAIKVPDMTGNS